nr:ATP-binding protein [uncultured Prevotella sp.]
MAQKLYPIGIQTFERIRKEDRFYVDKTEYVYRMTHTSDTYIFLSRPRRFGKSLLVSTLQSYFEGKKELFKGLAIEKLEKEWEEYPVLRFDMSGAKHQNEAELEQYLSYRLEDQEKLFGIHEHRDGINNRFMDLVEKVYKQTGKKVVILIDEYDAPLLDVVHDDDKLEKLRTIMRNFYSPLKYSESLLRFVFLTGITKFSQLSIFSELNNISNISMEKEYAGICGITKDEMLTQMSDDIDCLAEALSLTRDETIQKLKDNYDGYHFTWPAPDVFNPFSLINCFDKKRLGAFWFASGTPTFLIEMMRKFDVSPIDIGEKELADESDFDAPTEDMVAMTPLLYQSGYVTIKGYDEESQLYVLGIPNKEIWVGLFKSLLPNYLGHKTPKGKVAVAQMSVLLRKGDVDGAFELLKTFLGTVPYCDNTQYEGHYQQLMYVIFALLTDYKIIVEQRTAKGRTDITLETKDYIYVMELKFDKTADEALAQINDNHYADAFAMSGKPVIKVGINFSVKEERNITKWVKE